MEIKRVILVLADISGYTSFMRFHRTELIHAERIITDLIESVLDAADYPLTVSKLEGDAVFFYAEAGDDPTAAARSVLNQVQTFFKTFHQREQEIVSCNTCKQCQACDNAQNLRLKVIVHSGEVLIKQVRTFEELAGEDVILIHRLLKNSVAADEYLLMTDAFAQLLDVGPAWQQRPVAETYEHLGKVRGTVLFPPAEASPEYRPTLADKLRHNFRYSFYTLGRMLGLFRPVPLRGHSGSDTMLVSTL